MFKEQLGEDVKCVLHKMCCPEVGGYVDVWICNKLVICGQSCLNYKYLFCQNCVSLSALSLLPPTLPPQVV